MGVRHRGPRGIAMGARHRGARRGIAAALVAGGLLAALMVPAATVGAEDEAPLTGSDFTPLAIDGFSEVVDGANGLVPTGMGNPFQAFSWSMAFFDGAVFVGTGTIPPRDLVSSPAATRDRYRAEIWRYDFGGPDGSEGTWTRVHRSPLVYAPGFVTGGIPRDIGYRGMTVCDGRLWVAAFGLSSRILVSGDGMTFGQATMEGIPAGDLGVRGIECLDGHLVISPIGTVDNPDIASGPPVVLANDDPMTTGWTQINHPGFGDPDNLAVFSMAAWDRDGDGVKETLVASTINRTAGAQVWINDDPCALSTCAGAKDGWELALSHGAGRPFEPPWIRGDGRWGSHNAGAAWMAEYQGDLWIAFSEAASGGSGVGLGELVRLHPDGTYEVVTGLPRAPWPGYNAPADFSDLAALGGTASSYAALDVASGDIGATNFFENGPDRAIPYPLLDNPCDPSVDPSDPACRPSGDKGLGMAEVIDPAGPPPGFAQGEYDDLITELYADLNAIDGVDLEVPSPISADWEAVHPLIRLWIGATRLTASVSSAYLWQLTVHDGRLYVSGLDRSAARDGFDIWSTAGGPAPRFDPVMTDGFGDPANSGGRTMLSTGHGLVVGTLDLSSFRGVPGGGTEVWLGVS